MSQMSRDPDTYWRNAGLQLGREYAAVDALRGKYMDPKLYVPKGVHPAYAEALIEGYAEASGAANPIAIAMGGN